MFPTDRQAKLDPILTRLRAIDGVEDVQQDDFDSTGINVVITLKVSQICHTIRGHRAVPNRFTNGLRYIKAAVRGACNGRFNFLHWPTVQRTYNQASRRMERDGYDCSHIKIEVFV